MSIFKKVVNFLFDFVIADKRTYLFLIVFFAYTADMNVFYGSDTLVTQLLPLSLIRDGDFYLDEFMNSSFGTEFSVVEVNNHLVSKFPVFTSLISTPIYLAFMISGYEMKSMHDISLAGNLSATLITALSVVFLYVALKEITDERNAWYCALIYAFATCTWSVSSQDLWQHGASQMFLAASLYFLLKGLKDEHYTAYAGFTLACMVAARPPNIPIAVVLTVYVAHRQWRMLKRFLLWALPPVLFLLAYSWFYFGSLLKFGQAQYPLEGWVTPMSYGIASLLFSPSKGLFIYSPVLILSFIGIYYSWKNGNTMLKYLSASVFAMILLWSKWWAWHGANCYGYRMLLDITPILILFMIPVFQRHLDNKWFKYLLIALIAYSVIVQVVGVLFFDGLWDKEFLGLYYDKTGMQPAYWSLEKGELIHYFKKAFSTIKRLYP
ncbi:MAG: hypothetical protein V1703_00330 [Candidatus Altiarchaeota archaeon]